MPEGMLSQFDVALYCEDDTAIVYHVSTYPELVQSLIDISPIAGTSVRGVAVAKGGRQLSDTFTACALRATGIGRLIALAPPHMEQGDDVRGEELEE